MSAMAYPPLIHNPNVPRSRLTAAIDACPAYWSPILVAIRDSGVALCVVPQVKTPFDPPPHKPTIVLIGDDMHEAKGPQAFHQYSLQSFVKRCAGAVIVACEPLPAAYGAAASRAAILRQNVTIVETRPEHVKDWKSALDAINPDLSYLLCLVKPAAVEGVLDA
jgi:hypothetical protein